MHAIMPVNNCQLLNNARLTAIVEVMTFGGLHERVVCELGWLLAAAACVWHAQQGMLQWERWLILHN